MYDILVAIHCIIVVMLVVSIILQNSSDQFATQKDFMSVRPQSNPLAKFTAVLGVVFFILSLLITIFNVSNKII